MPRNGKKDDRPFVYGLSEAFGGGPPKNPAGYRDEDVELPMPKGGKKDPRLASPLEGLKKAAEGYKALKKKGLM
jgi:hypothetical protein